MDALKISESLQSTALVDGQRYAERHSRANVVNLNLKVIKEHVVKHDAFGFGYLVATADLVMELLVHSQRGIPQPIPMELMQIFNEADAQLKRKHNVGKAQDDIRKFMRTYVRLWGKLFKYIATKFDCFVAEHVLVEAYRRVSVQS